jgi:hypothetical protein
MQRNTGLKRTALVVGGLILLAVALILASGPAVKRVKSETTTDSGVSACKTMADNMAKKQTASSKKMTEASYKKIRAPFENSKYADIKVAGMNIVDTIYQADTQPDPDNIGGAMILMGTLQGQWGQLQTACMNHGVTVPALPKA